MMSSADRELFFRHCAALDAIRRAPMIEAEIFRDIRREADFCAFSLPPDSRVDETPGAAESPALRYDDARRCLPEFRCVRGRCCA